MIELEHDLRDLGEHLDHPPGDQIVTGLRARLSDPPERLKPRPRWATRRAIVPAMASAAAVVLLAVAIPPIRDAIVDRLRAGDSTQRDRTASPRQGSTITTAAPADPAIAVVDLETARAAVDFPIRVPALPQAAPAVTVDDRVPGGLVALEYPTFTIVEVASAPGTAATPAKAVGSGSRARDVTVRGRPGLWVTGTHHEIEYLDRDGNVRRGATRPTGHVLLWEEDGIIFRVEGFSDQASATDVASSIG